MIQYNTQTNVYDVHGDQDLAIGYPSLSFKRIDDAETYLANELATLMAIPINRLVAAMAAQIAILQYRHHRSTNIQRYRTLHD